jgi:hypothetical protein
MIHFEEGKDLQVINVNVDELVQWTEDTLYDMMGYEFTVFCRPTIWKNYLNYNIDETTMTERQWEDFTENLDTTHGYSDHNLINLLRKVFGEADYSYLVYELDEFYLIRHVKSTKEEDSDVW